MTVIAVNVRTVTVRNRNRHGIIVASLQPPDRGVAHTYRDNYGNCKAPVAAALERHVKTTYNHLNMKLFSHRKMLNPCLEQLPTKPP
jgi:hypothetical protein